MDRYRRDTSPFGHSGYNPSGVRIGGQSQHKKAAKVWEARRYKDYDSDRELGTRNLKTRFARRLRKFAREGAAEEPGPLQGRSTPPPSRAGWHVKMRPERRNAIKGAVVFFRCRRVHGPLISS